MIDSGYWDDQISELVKALRGLLEAYEEDIDSLTGNGHPDPNFDERFPAIIQAEEVLKRYE